MNWKIKILAEIWLLLLKLSPLNQFCLQTKMVEFLLLTHIIIHQENNNQQSMYDPFFISFLVPYIHETHKRYNLSNHLISALYLNQNQLTLHNHLNPAIHFLVSNLYRWCFLNVNTQYLPRFMQNRYELALLRSIFQNSNDRKVLLQGSIPKQI